MAVVHIIKPAKPSFSSFAFATYNEAVAFARKSAALNPSKPRKALTGGNGPHWVVSILNPRNLQARAEVVTFRAVPGFTGLAPACAH
jgi:hypothetical protein